MPEGPSIKILAEEAAGFAGKTIVRAEGNTSADKSRLVGQRIKAVRSWGKHFLLEFEEFSLRIHLLMCGSYRIKSASQTPCRGLVLPSQKTLSSSSIPARCAISKGRWIKRTTGPPTYSPINGIRRPRVKKLRAMPHALFCDALLDQAVFSGVGNIIKNEVLFRIRLHPLSTVGALPAPKLRALVEQARQYSFDFLQWKRPMCSGIGSRIPKRFARAAISLQQGPPRQDQATKFLLRQLSGSLRFPATFTMSCAAQRTQHDKMSDYNPQGRVTG
jgi:endonuclease-8